MPITISKAAIAKSLREVRDKAREQGRAEGRAEAARMLEFAVKLNGHGPATVKALRDGIDPAVRTSPEAATPEAEDDRDPNPLDAATLAYIDALIEAKTHHAESDGGDVAAALRQMIDDPRALEAALSGDVLPEAEEDAEGIITKGGFDESKHPRDDSGRFVGREAIHAAKSDPALAEKLREKTTDPEERKKLDAALAGEADLGRTKAGLHRDRVAASKQQKAERLGKVRKLAEEISMARRGGEDVPPEHFTELAAELPHLTVGQLRSVRESLAASFWGRRRRDEMVTALVRHAKVMAERKRAEQEATDALDFGMEAMSNTGGTGHADAGRSDLNPWREFDKDKSFSEAQHGGRMYQRHKLMSELPESDKTSHGTPDTGSVLKLGDKPAPPTQATEDKPGLNEAAANTSISPTADQLGAEWENPKALQSHRYNLMEAAIGAIKGTSTNASIRRNMIYRLLDNDETAKHIPKGSRFLGAGFEAVAFKTPQGDVVRLSLDSGDRPDVPEVLQPTQVSFVGNRENGSLPVRVERLPLAAKVAKEAAAKAIPAIHQSLAEKGYEWTDDKLSNVGLVDGKVVIIDPGNITAKPGITPAQTQQPTYTTDPRPAASVMSEAASKWLDQNGGDLSKVDHDAISAAARSGQLPRKAELELRRAKLAAEEASEGEDAPAPRGGLQMEKPPPGGWKESDKVGARVQKQHGYDITPRHDETDPNNNPIPLDKVMPDGRTLGEIQEARREGFRQQYGADSLNPLKTPRDKYAGANWQYTLIDQMHRPDILGGKDRDTEVAHHKEQHRQAVAAALAAGKPVPPEVLADYPDLKQPSQESPNNAPVGAAEPEKSKGHVAFVNGIEYFRDDDGTLLRADSKLPIDTTGKRFGRFEAPAHLADMRVKMLTGQNQPREKVNDAGAKEPHQYSRKDYLGSESDREAVKRISNEHREAVRAAIAAGKDVSPEVLADYPDLDPKKSIPTDHTAALSSAKAHHNRRTDTKGKPLPAYTVYRDAAGKVQAVPSDSYMGKELAKGSFPQYKVEGQYEFGADGKPVAKAGGAETLPKSQENVSSTVDKGESKGNITPVEPQPAAPKQEKRMETRTIRRGASTNAPQFSRGQGLVSKDGKWSVVMSSEAIRNGPEDDDIHKYTHEAKVRDASPAESAMFDAKHRAAALKKQLTGMAGGPDDEQGAAAHAEKVAAAKSELAQAERDAVVAEIAAHEEALTDAAAKDPNGTVTVSIPVGQYKPGTKVSRAELMAERRRRISELQKAASANNS